MCRPKADGGRRCAACSNPTVKRGYARAKYAADTIRHPDGQTSPPPPGSGNRDALVAAWGDRGQEIADLVDGVPTLEDLAALHAQHRGTISMRALRGRPVADLAAEDRLALKVAAMYEAEFPGCTPGSTAAFRVTVVTVAATGITVTGEFVDTPPGGTAVRCGNFERLLIPPHGERTVWGARNIRLMLRNSHQGHKYGTRMVRHSENALIAAGFGYVDLDAADKVGGYAWAKEGYDWRPGTEPVEGNLGSNVRAHLKGQARKTGDPDGAIKAMLKRLNDRRSPETYPTPAEVARLGWTPGAQTWPGREALTGSWWSARRTLVPPGIAASATGSSTGEPYRLAG